jgi:hypothetical protein
MLDVLCRERPISLPARTRLACGLRSLNIGGANTARVERSYHNTRLDGVDQFVVICQLAGRAALKHNDERVRLDPGDVALVDAVLPYIYSVRLDHAAPLLLRP